MPESTSIDENLWFDGFCHIKIVPKVESLRDDLLDLIFLAELIVHQLCKDRQPAADAESKHERNHKIEKDVRLVRFACLAIVFCFTVLAFDMSEHVGSERAAPPCITDLLRNTLSAVGTGGILRL